MSSIHANAYAKIVSGGVEAAKTVDELRSAGYPSDDIYVLAHERDRTDQIADLTAAQEIGIKEEGILTSIANLFRSRGDELRAKIVSLGFTEAEAAFYEKELDLGKVLVIAIRRE